MPTFDNWKIPGGQGAIFYLQAAPRKSSTLEVAGGVAAIGKGSRAFWVAIEEAIPDAGGVLTAAVQVAQECLDIWAIRGIALALSAVEDDHVVWWTVGVDTHCRMLSASRFSLVMEAHGTVLGPDGRPIPPVPTPLPIWHPSFRYFRLGQVTTDLVDAFRNYYLAFESILSTLEPIRVIREGKLETDHAWLSRALPKAASLVDFSRYTPEASPPGDDVVRAVWEDIYKGARTATFHAKEGARALLPHDDVTRAQLNGTVERLRRLYIDLAQEVLGPRFLVGGGLSRAGFRAFTGGVTIESIYLSADEFDSASFEAAQLPTNYTLLTATALPEFDDEYRVAYAGTVDPAGLSDQTIRQAGAVMPGSSQVALAWDLEGRLDVGGFASVQVILVMAGEDPRALGTRYKS